MRRRSVALALAAALVGAAVGAGCMKTAVPDHDRAAKQEVHDLWMQIREWRREGKMSLDPPTGLVQLVQMQPMSTARAVCPVRDEPPEPECDDVCSLADAICDNAERICDIADTQLRGDEWAADKCSSAKASCNEAEKRCCKCNGDDVSLR